MRRVLAWTLPVLLLLALVALTAVVVAPAVEDDIRAQTVSVVSNAGYDGITIAVDGQNIRLSDGPTDPTEAARLANLVKDNVDGALDVVVALPPVDRRTGAPDSTPNVVVQVGDEVVVSGTVATRAQVTELTALIAEGFGPGAMVDLRTNPGFDPEIVETPLVAFQPVLEAISDGAMVEGTVELRRRAGGGPRDYGLFINGLARNEPALEAIETAARRSNLPAGLQLGLAESIAPEFTGEQLEPELLRITLFTIRYPIGEITLSEADVALLEELAGTMTAYPTIELTVVGHRSSTEGPLRGQRRADVVAERLVLLGVDEERITVRDASDLEKAPGSADTLNPRVTFEPAARSTP